MLKRLLDLLSDHSIVPFDARASVVNLLNRNLPTILKLVLCGDDESSAFGEQFILSIKSFWERLTVILLHSIGRAQTLRILAEIIGTFFASVPAYNGPTSEAKTALQWLRNHIYTHMRKYLHDTGKLSFINRLLRHK